MGDEEYGRAWAAMMGIKGPRRIRGRFGFHYLVDDALFSRDDPTDPDSRRMEWWYDTEAKAYTALGRAIRRVLGQVPPLAAAG